MSTQKVIEEGYLAVIANLTDQYESYIKDSHESPEDFEGITKGDVITWLIEGLS
jgi:hypothetical protein